MTEQRAWDYAVGAAIGAALAVLLVLIMDWNNPGRTHETRTTTNIVEMRWLTCEEDEDIIITPDRRGLPTAFCKQVIER